MKNAGAMTVVFAGNPNCGKTTLFNSLTGSTRKTGNWPGVTLEAAKGLIEYGGEKIEAVDLPGMYSVSEGLGEEESASSFLKEQPWDKAVNVISALSLERGLALTLELMQYKKPVIVAVNMMDLAERRGLSIDPEALSKALGGSRVVLISARKESGLDRLMEAVERALPPETGRPFPSPEEMARRCVEGRDGKASHTSRVDRVLLHPFWGMFCLFAVVFLIFFLTFQAGDFIKLYFGRFLDGISLLAERGLKAAGCGTMLSRLILEGILPGVFGVLLFLPNLSILFLCMGILEDSGYMARIAWLANDGMEEMGLPGKASFPLLLGLGCSVPAVMSTKVIESKAMRRKTMFLIPFMSCSAKLPVYILFSSMFFGEKAAAVSFFMYILGGLSACILARLWKKLLREEREELLIELPDYQLPSPHTLWLFVREKIFEYLKKAGTVIFLASVVLWLLLNVPVYFQAAEDEIGGAGSAAAFVGKMLCPLFSPIGLGQWQTVVALIGGLSAKEVVVAGFFLLYGVPGIAEEGGLRLLACRLAQAGFGPANAVSLMVFTLFYTPCAATFGTVKKESGSLAFAAGQAVFQLGFAWAVSWLAYHICLWLPIF